MEILSPEPSSSHGTSVAQKVRSRDAARRYKYGSPKLVDLMREKCRIRIQEARNDQFLRKRNIAKEEQAFVESIVREQLSELEQDIALQELIYQELMQDTDEWLFAEQSENYLIEAYETDSVFCPICERRVLQLDLPAMSLSCDCGVKLRYNQPTTEEFAKLIAETLAQHTARCENSIQFFTEPIVDEEYVQLNAFCPCCDYYRGLTC